MGKIKPAKTHGVTIAFSESRIFVWRADASSGLLLITLSNVAEFSYRFGVMTSQVYFESLSLRDALIALKSPYQIM